MFVDLLEGGRGVKQVRSFVSEEIKCVCKMGVCKMGEWLKKVVKVEFW